MNWNQLLSFERVGDNRAHTYDTVRPPWQTDYDRIVFLRIIDLEDGFRLGRITCEEIGAIFMPHEFREDIETGKPHPNPYLHLPDGVDFVAGMTDSFALTLFRRIKGMALPN